MSEEVVTNKEQQDQERKNRHKEYSESNELQSKNQFKDDEIFHNVLTQIDQKKQSEG